MPPYPRMTLPGGGRESGVLCKAARIGYASAIGMGEASMDLRWPVLAGLVALVIGVAARVADANAPAGATALTCTNPASGATWQITIDYDKATVDANPASIDDAEISWRDAKDGGHYTLDRKSGDLTVIIASSTGGYFVNDRCDLKSSG